MALPGLSMRDNDTVRKKQSVPGTQENLNVKQRGWNYNTDIPDISYFALPHPRLHEQVQTNTIAPTLSVAK